MTTHLVHYCYYKPTKSTPVPLLSVRLNFVLTIIEDCYCPDPSGFCLMSATVTSPDPLMWSNCSIRELQQGLEIQGLGSCLTNDPVIVFTDPLCGNGIRETGEACDCGSQEVGLYHC